MIDGVLTEKRVFKAGLQPPLRKRIVKMVDTRVKCGYKSSPHLGPAMTPGKRDTREQLESNQGAESHSGAFPPSASRYRQRLTLG